MRNSVPERLNLAQLIFVDRDQSRSTFTQSEGVAFKDWLDEYSLGELRKKNVIDRRPSRHEQC